MDIRYIIPDHRTRLVRVIRNSFINNKTTHITILCNPYTAQVTDHLLTFPSITVILLVQTIERKVYDMTKKIKSNKISESCGWIGMILIHGATAPTSISVLMGWSTQLPPLNFILLVWLGLFLFLIRAIYAKDTLYIVSNAIGFSLNSLLLTLIAFN